MQRVFWDWLDFLDHIPISQQVIAILYCAWKRLNVGEQLGISIGRISFSENNIAQYSGPKNPIQAFWGKSSKRVPKLAGFYLELFWNLSECCRKCLKIYSYLSNILKNILLSSMLMQLGKK